MAKPVALLQDLEPLTLLRGPVTFWRGIKWVFSHPKYLFLGLLPALFSGLIIAAAIAVLILSSGFIASLLGPLTASLWAWLATAITIGAQVALVAGGVVLGYVLFVAITLAVGDPIYSKIAEEIAEEHGAASPQAPWSVGVKDALRLVGKGTLVALVAFLLGLVPGIGTVLSFTATWLFVPFFLAEDLLGRTLVPRLLEPRRKAELLRTNRTTVWSFGALCQLIFTIPVLSIFFMPASVAGASLLAQELLASRPPASTPTDHPN